MCRNVLVKVKCEMHHKAFPSARFILLCQNWSYVFLSILISVDFVLHKVFFNSASRSKPLAQSTCSCLQDNVAIELRLFY